MVSAIQKGFAKGCDYVTALALFGVAERTGVIEQNPIDADYYRIVSQSNAPEDEQAN